MGIEILAALGDHAAVAIEHIEGCDRAHGRFVEQAIEVDALLHAGEHQLLEIGHDDVGQAAGLEHMAKAGQHHGYLVLAHMLEIVGAIHRIKLLRRQAGELSHVEHDVGPNAGIKIEQNLLERGVGGRQLDPAGLAAHIEDPSLVRRCFDHPGSVLETFFSNPIRLLLLVNLNGPACHGERIFCCKKLCR